MKKFLFILIVIAIVLIVTNPNKSDYSKWQTETIKDNTNQIIPDKVIDWINEDVIDYRTKVVDYKLFSFYETTFTEVGLEPMKAIGIVSIFIPLPSQFNVYSLGNGITSILSFVGLILALFIALRIVRFIVKMTTKKNDELDI